MENDLKVFSLHLFTTGGALYYKKKAETLFIPQTAIIFSRSVPEQHVFGTVGAVPSQISYLTLTLCPNQEIDKCPIGVLLKDLMRSKSLETFSPAT